jgi:hypothetical protein
VVDVGGVDCSDFCSAVVAEDNGIEEAEAVVDGLA